ncbi:MAG TPA: glycosyltransferase family 4 protein, partial [Bacteroidales bacterium]|nr:glycosyltransferase family 4 protein [Bacteroidales bacterium]
MHILLIAHFAGSPYHGMVFGHYYLAREWVKMGHEVTIVAASYSHARFNQPQQNKSIRAENIDGINYLWVTTKPYDPKLAFQRVRNILEYTLKLQGYRSKFTAPDLVICSSHHPFPIYTAHYLSRKYNAALVFEVRDLWPLTLIELGSLSKKNPFIWLMQRAEDYAYRHAQLVVSVLPASKDYMLSRGMKPQKFVHIPNGINLDEIATPLPLPPSHIQKLDELRNESEFIIGYAGKTGLSNALPTLLDAIHLLDDRQIAVAFLGSGADTDDLKQKSTDLVIDKRVIFLEPVNKNQVQDFLQRIDAAYVGAIKSPLYRFGMSLTKLNDFMLAGKPIIYAIE